jgi:hypothetical protein
MEKSNNVPAVGSLGIIQKRMIVWGPDGVPRPSSVPTISRQGIEDLAAVALSLPYKIPEVPLNLPDKEHQEAVARREDEMEFEGMTNAEVMIVKLARSAAGGDAEATSMLLDRVLGRPKQSVESKSMTMTYADVLKEKAAREKALDVVCEVVRDELDGLL